MALDGNWGEDAAARHARAHGAQVLARNFRTKVGELDLVLLHEGVIAFGEVKARTDLRHGGGLEAVTPRKQRRIARTAMLFLIRQGYDPDAVRCRFDVFDVRPGPQVTWVQDAFQIDG